VSFAKNQYIIKAIQKRIQFLVDLFNSKENLINTLFYKSAKNTQRSSFQGSNANSDEKTLRRFGWQFNAFFSSKSLHAF
jgi:hypothetical protein